LNGWSIQAFHGVPVVYETGVELAQSRENGSGRRAACLALGGAGHKTHDRPVFIEPRATAEPGVKLSVQGEKAAFDSGYPDALFNFFCTVPGGPQMRIGIINSSLSEF